ncbi:recombinase family protein [Aliarcobacter cryaerophilus]|uniref:Resolvase/invertase-type recombinase catalytic domain-containing protein n=1 Tax=Aliarcobacter cryaerophilus TaxID=28198 RepID=A0A2S9TL34_9BACT|nr:recombinase family protein [Aliarcobacter cryaerophilus]PRM99523.1 hypothetical protein CJ670_00370 [Arcobacter cryaerophilus gv. crypticus]
MSKYYAYIRVSTDKQTLENQKHKILEFAFNKKIQIEDFIEVEVSSVGTQRIWPPRALTLGHLTHNDLATVRISK